jgi:hypothetical protein
MFLGTAVKINSLNKTTWSAYVNPRMAKHGADRRMVGENSRRLLDHSEAARQVQRDIRSTCVLARSCKTERSRRRHPYKENRDRQSHLPGFSVASSLANGKSEAPGSLKARKESYGLGAPVQPNFPEICQNVPLMAPRPRTCNGERDIVPKSEIHHATCHRSPENDIHHKRHADCRP